MVKDKNKPKGPMSAYACFVQVIREEHKKKHPEESVVFSEFSKKCAEKWKTMTDYEKKRFDDMASRDKERYIREMDAYVPPDGMKKPRKRRRNKDPGQPKRALSAFFFFCEEKRPAVRAEHPEWKVGDIAKELGRQWEFCQCKGKYEGQAVADKSRYEREMIEYKNGTFSFTKRARMEDVIPVGESSGMTGAAAAAGNGYLMRPAGSMPQYGVAAVATPGAMPQQAAPAFEAGVKTEMPPGVGPSFGQTADTALSHPNAAAFTHQAFPQPAASQPSSGLAQEAAPVGLPPQGYQNLAAVAQDLSAPPPPVANPAVAPVHPTPGGDTVDLAAERNGAAMTHPQLDSVGAEDEEEEEEDEDDVDDDEGDE